MPLSPASALLALDGSADVRAVAPGSLSPVADEARSQTSERASQTASEFITSQLKLEAEARDVLPYSFDTCTKDMGPLRQNLFACLTCNPPSKDQTAAFTPAGICYACSISCHGEHELVELFTRRNFVCDCGTSRLPETSPCTLREDPSTGTKGSVHSQEPASTNTYNQNFRNRFCACEEWYDPMKQKGTMFQCIGLLTEEEGGCGEDWWHPECLIGLPRDWYLQKGRPEVDSQTGTVQEDQIGPHNESSGIQDHPVPPGFPSEDTFDQLICYKCVEKVPWLKQYAHADGFIGLPKKGHETADAVIYGKHSTTFRPKELQVVPETPDDTQGTKKRNREELGDDQDTVNVAKRAKTEEIEPRTETASNTKEEGMESKPVACNATHLSHQPEGLMTILGPEDFRDKFCRCQDHYLKLREYPMLLEDEETYEPPISEDGDGVGGMGSVGTGSLLDRGEAALSNVDRVRAIEGVMVYNHLKSKVKDFLKPFAENGQMVSAEDIKAYFEKLRGDAEAIKDAKAAAADDGDDSGDNRREQSGY